MKNGWLEEVEQIMQGINKKFKLLFRQLKCTVEVELRVPDPDGMLQRDFLFKNVHLFLQNFVLINKMQILIILDFTKYGVKIMVSFRSDEAMQELTAWQQSGGEKSVSTMM